MSAAESAGDAVKPSGKKGGAGGNTVVLALGALNFLAVAGLGAFLVLRPPAGGGAAAPAEGEHGAAASEHHEGEHHELGPLVEFESMIVNLADPGGSRYLKVTFQLELSSEEEAAGVEHHLVPVRDRILTHLGSLSVADVTGPDARTHLREQIVTLANEALGGGEAVRSVYFTEYLVQ